MNKDTGAQQEGREILLEFLLSTLSQHVLFKTLGGKKKRKAAGLGAETEGRVVGLFIFSS